MAAFELTHWVGVLLSGVAAGYAGVALLASWPSRPRRTAAAPEPPPASVLKPLCGAEPELYECLRSFFLQEHPAFQLIFGVRDAADPAVAVVRKLLAEFPRQDAKLVIEPRQHGSSAKVSNLINMLPLARHECLVIADADVVVPRHYLANVVAPLADPKVGIVTCPYYGRARPGAASALGALFINGWFIPSVRIAALFGSRAFAFGVTIALRRPVLEGIGGFARIVNQLADDYRLGELTRAQGRPTVLSAVTVDTVVDEGHIGALIGHELRWLRTIRAVRPAGYAAAGLTFPLPLAVLGWAAAGASPSATTLLAATAAARLLLHFVVSRRQDAWRQVCLVPLSDTLGFSLWLWGFARREVRWRNTRYWIARDGSAKPLGPPSAS